MSKTQTIRKLIILHNIMGIQEENMSKRIQIIIVCIKYCSVR